MVITSITECVRSTCVHPGCQYKQEKHGRHRDDERRHHSKEDIAQNTLGSL